MRDAFIAVFMTCATRREARSIADALLKERLIACANMIDGVESRFRWKGRLHKAAETLVVMKTKRSNLGRIDRRIRSLHSYEVPEIVALPLSAGSAPYLKWLADSVK